MQLAHHAGCSGTSRPPPVSKPDTETCSAGPQAGLSVPAALLPRAADQQRLAWRLDTTSFQRGIRMALVHLKCVQGQTTSHILPLWVCHGSGCLWVPQALGASPTPLPSLLGSFCTCRAGDPLESV